MRIGNLLLMTGILGTLAAAPVGATGSASGKFLNTDKKEVGNVELRETPNGVVVHAELRNLPAGEHGFHIHQTGRCEPPFKSAGDHLAPDDQKHGFANSEGPHAGDLPNVFVAESGKAQIEVFAQGLTMKEILDDDGAAVVVHAGVDDYETDPAGDAGDRIACAKLE